MPPAAPPAPAPAETGLAGLPDMAGVEPSQARMKATLQAYVDRTNAGDAEGVFALFAPGAWIEDPIGTPRKSGEELRALFVQGAAYGARLRMVASSRGSFANEAALVFEVEYAPPGGKRLRVRSLDACRFDAEGRITSFRAYWGPDDIEEIDE